MYVILKYVSGSLCFLVGWALPLLAQPALAPKADSLKQAGALAEAAQAYQHALDQHPDQPALFFDLARVYALQPHQRASAFHYLNRTLAHDSTMRPLWDTDLFFLRTDTRWKAIETKQLDKLETQVAGPFNRSYARALLAMRMKEHAYRYHLMLAMRETGRESPLVAAFAHVMQTHHTENLRELELLIEQNGWPLMSEVGEAAAYAAGNIINHADLATRKRYLPLLQAACEQQEADWARYARILDRIELEEGNPQVYGTQMVFNEEKQRFEPEPLLAPDEVDARRAAIGLEPLADQVARFNASVLRDFGISNK